MTTPNTPVARRTVHWLLGYDEPDGFVYEAHETVRRGVDRGIWCALRSDAEVTVCGRHAPTSPGSRAVQVYATCAECGQHLRASKQACPVPEETALSLAANFWRLRNEEIGA